MKLQPQGNIICHTSRRVDYQGPRYISRVCHVKKAIEDALIPAGNQAGASDMETGIDQPGLPSASVPNIYFALKAIKAYKSSFF